MPDLIVFIDNILAGVKSTCKEVGVVTFCIFAWFSTSSCSVKVYHFVTCDQSSLYFRGGKERLIQLLIKISVSENVGDAIKNEPSTITGSRFVGGHYSRHEQREFTCSAVHYFVIHVLLFRS